MTGLGFTANILGELADPSQLDNTVRGALIDALTAGKPVGNLGNFAIEVYKETLDYFSE